MIYALITIEGLELKTIEMTYGYGQVLSSRDFNCENEHAKGKNSKIIFDKKCLMQTFIDSEHKVELG
jgi:hypothetical protein